MITSAQCRAGRALVEISRETLARLAKTDVSVVENFERKLERPDPADISRIQQALELAGAVFIPESENGGGAGVHLKFSRSFARRLSVFEEEGGTARPDKVP